MCHSVSAFYRNQPVRFVWSGPTSSLYLQCWPTDIDGDDDDDDAVPNDGDDAAAVSVCV